MEFLTEAERAKLCGISIIQIVRIRRLSTSLLIMSKHVTTPKTVLYKCNSVTVTMLGVNMIDTLNHRVVNTDDFKSKLREDVEH